MKRFYTVDRAGTLSAGLQIDIVKHDDISPAHLQKHVDDLFPDGISGHGDSYFLNGNSSGNLASPYIELALEYVRRASYPDKPSRFQSFFAVETLDEAKEFRKHYGKATDSIWEVQAEGFFKGDMLWFGLGEASILYHSYAFHSYWQGMACPNPFWEVLLKLPVKIIAKTSA